MLLTNLFYQQTFFNQRRCRVKTCFCPINDVKLHLSVSIENLWVNCFFYRVPEFDVNCAVKGSATVTLTTTNVLKFPRPWIQLFWQLVVSKRRQMVQTNKQKIIAFFVSFVFEEVALCICTSQNFMINCKIVNRNSNIQTQK